MTRVEFTDKIRAIRGLCWYPNLQRAASNIKFIIWDVWLGGF